MKRKILFPIILLLIMSCGNPTASPGTLAFIALQGEDKILVVDIDNESVYEEVEVNLSNVSDLPHYIVIDETNQRWYASLIASGHILQFSLQNNELLDSIYVGNQPALMALDEANRFLYISRFMPMAGGSAPASQEIQKINTTDMTLMGTVNIGASSPHGIALASDGATVWIASNQASHFFRVKTDRFGEAGYQPEHYKIDPGVPDNFAIPDNIYSPLEIELSHDDRILYIACSNAGEVRAYDTETGQLLHVYTVGNTPWHLVVSPDDEFVYVTNRMANTVSRIRIDDGSVTDLSDALIDMPHGIAMNHDGSLLVVSSFNGNRLHFINTADFSIHYTLGLSGDIVNPSGIAIVQE